MDEDLQEWQAAHGAAPEQTYNTRPASFARDVVAPTLSFNNAINPFGDEMVAGGASIWDDVTTGIGNLFRDKAVTPSTYEDKLNLVRSLEGGFRQDAPLAATLMDVYGATKLPIGNPFKQTKTIGDALGNVAKATGVSGGISALFGFGSGEGLTQAPVSADPDLAEWQAAHTPKSRIEGGLEGLGFGSLLGAGGATLVEGGKGLGKVGSWLKDALMPDIATKADEVATEVLSQYTDPKTVISSLMKPNAPLLSPSNMRTAEIANDPGLALLTKTLEKNIPEAGFRGESIDSKRAMDQMKLFLDAQGPVRTPEKVGQLIREGLEEGSDKLGKDISKQYALAEKGNGTVPIFEAKMSVSDAMESELAKGRSIDPASRAIIDKVREAPNNLSMSELQFQRQNVGSMIGDLRNMSNASPEQKTGLKVLNKLFGALDDAEKVAAEPGTKTVTKSGIIKGLNPSQAKAVEKGRELRSLKGELYEEKAGGDILDKNRFGRYSAQDSDVLGKAISGPEEARQIMTGIKANARSKAAYQSGLMEKLKLRSTNPTTGEFEIGKFATNWRNTKETAKEVLSPVQMQAVQTVRKDLLSRQNLERIVGHASKRQSISAQDLGAAAFLKDSIGQAARSKTGIFGKIFSTIGDSQSGKITAKADEILVELAFDQKFARDFLGKATPKAVSRISNELLNRMGVKASIPILSSLDENKKENRSVIDKALTKAEAKMEETKAPVVEEKIAPTTKEDKKLEPLFKAVVMQESENNPRAVSSVGALGLMQVMPETARDIARELGVSKYDLKDPETNKKFGQHYLKQLINKYDGDIELALTAYHSGMGRVDRLLKEYKGTTLDDILPGLGPIGRKYAKQVIARIKKPTGQVEV